MKRIYLAGPMRGRTRHNYPAFDIAATQLRAQGWIVVSPKELSECFGYTDPDAAGNFPLMVDRYEVDAFIRQDIEAILRCDAIGLLPGWADSKGAKMERAVAEMAGKEIIYV